MNLEKGTKVRMRSVSKQGKEPDQNKEEEHKSGRVEELGYRVEVAEDNIVLERNNFIARENNLRLEVKKH